MPTTTIVTGAARGLGAAIARHLGARGHHVIVNYRTDSDGAAGVVEDIEAAGGAASSARADVTDPAAVEALIAGVLARHGRIDTVVVNANTAPPPFAPLISLSWNDFAAKMTGELAGAFHITKRVLEPMRAQGDGRLVYIGSTAADYVGEGRLAHGTAKSALATFARHVAAESGRDGVCALVVAPGAVRTPATAGLLDGDRGEVLARESVLGRILEPEDVAAAVALAADPALRPATGTVLRVDGGWSVLVGGPAS
ncbi:SDR family oxidoreductase [Amycolatopsis azurea]|uniref:3-oxoacyl-[acyl-carrier protein] reductase n=1 Tax=Amycolatopsis azurea DSM 43854 TaxID=1238180 RepID=M2QRL1_9PSEU|nr:SDR family oxidoreductase [Amycolatopsis azurea]EMD29291.1 3-oxoacyl-[acyl-carrier protein] reductase [Amycolatopsis azurea DSM 43854]OOC01878.1 short-chain dehydrogenase [Amycolatopsis azurea DSM 43854]